MRSFDPRPDQLETIAAITTALAGAGSRATAVLPCGYGKTFVAQQAAEQLTADLSDPLILVAVPNLVLVDQMIQDWTKNASDGCAFAALPVNSRKGRKAEDEITGITIEGVTADPDEIARFLTGTGRRVVFSTYQSMDTIAAAVQKVAAWRPGFAFDLAIADEAHRTAGPLRGAEPSSYKTILDDARIPSHRRAFYTATPRVASAKAGSDEHPYSMDNTAMYGQTVVNRSLTWAQQEGLLVEHDVFVVQVDHDGLERVLDANPLIRVDGSAEEARMVAAAIALVQTARSRHLRSVITYHSGIAKAQAFQRLLEAVEQALPASEKPAGRLRTGHVNGAMPTAERTNQLQILDATGAASGDWSVVTNVNCLAEGVNIPSVDAIAIIDPRRSLINIVQSIGRPIRLDPSRPHKRATVLVPAYVGTAQTAEEAIEEGSFEAVFQTIKALAGSDQALAEAFRQAAPRTADAEEREAEEREVIGFADADREWAEGEAPESRITFISPAVHVLSDAGHTAGELVDWSRWHESLRTELMTQHATSWDRWLDLFMRFVATHHRLPSAVEVFEGAAIGPWLIRQARQYRAGKLSLHQVQGILSAHPEALTRVASKEARMLAHLAQFVAEHHRLPKSNEEHDGVFVGRWLSAARARHRIGRLNPEKAQALLNVHPETFPARAKIGFNDRVEALRRFLLAHGRLPEVAETFEGEKIGWWLMGVRSFHRSGKLSPSRQRAMLAVHPQALVSANDDLFEQSVAAFRSFVSEHGRLPKEGESHEGIGVGLWLRNLKRPGRIGRITSDRREAILAIHPDALDGVQEVAFKRGLNLISLFLRTEGRLPSEADEIDGFKLRQWLRNQRVAYQKGKLSPERAAAILAVAPTAFDGIEERRLPAEAA